MASSDKEIVLVTGGNTGLGLEIVRALAASPTAYHVLIGARNPAKGEAAIRTVRAEIPDTRSEFGVVQVDLESDASLEAAAAAIAALTPGGTGRLDVLINNGGASFDQTYHPGGEGNGTSARELRDMFNRSWDVNVSGTHVLTSLLAPLLLRSAAPRLLFITSGTSTLEETEDVTSAIGARLNGSPDKGWPKDLSHPGKKGAGSPTAYRSVKCGLNMVMREWTRILREDGVRVWAVSPGFLATSLGSIGADKLKAMGALDPAIGGRFVRDVVEGKRDGDVGKVIRRDMIQPW